MLFLSQPFEGCVQKCQLARRILCLGLQLRPPDRKERLQPLTVVIDLEHPDDVGEGEAHVLQRGDAARRGQLILPVIPIIREAVDLDGLQESDLIVVAQHSDADPGQLRKFSDLQHGGTSKSRFLLSSDVL